MKCVLLTLASLLLLAGCATGPRLPLAPPEAGGGSGEAADEAFPCATQALPADWPDASVNDRQALLAPFLSCSSPADFLALQQRVDMPGLVSRLDAWSAVRLGALGPVREEASGPLNRQRALFLLQSLERHGPANTEVLALFVLDSSHDDDLREILFLLAQDKRLVELLEQLPSLGPALEARGFKPSAHSERDFQWSDVGRGLDRAARDALSTSPMVNGLQSTLMEFYELKAQLPPPYQQALDDVEHAQREHYFSGGHLTLGFLDHMTFGVPMGVYSLAAGTTQGVQSLARGRYEEAVRELAPLAVLVALSAGGKGEAWLSEERGLPGVGPRGLRAGAVLESRLSGLQERVRQVRELLGEQGLHELAAYIRARREAGRLVAVGGMDAALALHEARGDVGQAQAMLSKARPGATGTSTGKGGTRGVSQEGAAREGETARPLVEQSGSAGRPGTLAAWVDEGAGLTREVVQAKLAAAELESPSQRLSTDVSVLEKQRPSLEAPPPKAQGNPRWSEYVTYYEKRMVELKEGKADKGPLRWEAYERMWGGFTRGLEFERAMTKLLRADAALPRAQRRYLGEFDKPRVETYVGVKKPGTGLRFADMLVIEEGELGGRPPRVETLSFKSRDLSGLEYDSLRAQMIEDAREALHKYGETLSIRRESLRTLLQQDGELVVQRVRLVYEGGVLMPREAGELKRALSETRARVPGTEVLFQ